MRKLLDKERGMHLRWTIAVLISALQSIALAGAATLEPVAATPSRHASSCVRFLHGYLWISCGLALLLALGMWKRARVVQLLVQRFPHQASPDNASQATNARLLLCGLGFILSCACGVIGIVLSTRHLAPCASEVDVAHGQQLQFTLTIVVASAWLLVTLVLLATGVSVSIQAISPGQETSPALVCLRCSCCSLLLKRLVLFAPVVTLSIDNFASWRASHMFTAQHADCTLSFPPTFFGGASMLFFVMALAQLLSYAITRASPPYERDPATTASPVDGHAPAVFPPRVRIRRQHKRLVLLGLLAFSISSIAWATMGWIWIVRNHAVSSQTCDELQSMRDAMNVSIVLLFLIGWVVFTLAVCCRLEDIVLAPTGLPMVDPDTLSPRLTRISVMSQPTASPAKQQLRKASFTSDVV